MQRFFDEEGVNVGDNHAISGTIDGVPYNLSGMKELDYVMRMMATGGPLSGQRWRVARRRFGSGWKLGWRSSVGFDMPVPLTGSSGIVVLLTITTTFAMGFP